MSERADADRALEAVLQTLKRRGYEFTTTTPVSHAHVNARPGSAVASDLRGVFGWSRPFPKEVVGSDLRDLMDAAGILVRDGELCRSAVRVSSFDGELFAHSASPTTAADSVFFGPDTYRFGRAILGWLTVERVRAVRRVADIGAGAGPGGILVARSAPGAEVVLVDINEAALRLATVNAVVAGARNVTAIRSDLLTAVGGSFDLIVSNPPYLNDPLQRAYRHGGGPYGADLSLRILGAALDRLAPAGTLILYTGAAIVNGRDPFRAAATERMGRERVRWSYDEVDPDVFGEELATDAYATADRIAAVCLVATKED